MSATHILIVMVQNIVELVLHQQHSKMFQLLIISGLMCDEKGILTFPHPGQHAPGLIIYINIFTQNDVVTHISSERKYVSVVILS